MQAWQADLRKRIKERLLEHGFQSATAFADASPGTSLVPLAATLGDGDVPAVWLERMLLDEAEASGQMERCARDLLVREIRDKLPEGWHRDWREHPLGSSAHGVRFRTLNAMSGWASPIGLRFPRHEDAIARVCKFLREGQIPDGWLPAGPDDPLLVEIFRVHWADQLADPSAEA